MRWALGLCRSRRAAGALILESAAKKGVIKGSIWWQAVAGAAFCSVRRGGCDVQPGAAAR